MKPWETEFMRIKQLLNEMNARFLSVQEYIELQYLLMRQEDLFRQNYPLCKTSMTADKIMFIADTHRGNATLENKNLVSIAYNRAIQLGIKTVVHAGDLTEACCVDHGKEYEIVLKELETALSDMPNELTTGLVLGNHDYSAIRTYPDIIQYYFANPKLYVLGMQKVMLNWGGIADILVSHPITQLKMRRLELNPTIIVEAHHHYYHLHEENQTIDLPSLSSASLRMLSTPLYDKKLKYCPLFVIASKQDEQKVTFEINCIDVEQKGHILPGETIEVDTTTKRIRLYK